MEKQIQADMVAAMKAKETVRLASLRSIKAAIMLAKTAEGATGEVDDTAIVKIIQKLVKQRKESAQQYMDAGRPELAENELAEAACMEVYLPKQLSEAEVEAKLAEIIAYIENDLYGAYGYSYSENTTAIINGTKTAADVFLAEPYDLW